MNKRIIIVGGGHAHLTLLANIGRFITAGHSVTVINAARFHYYSGMGPGLLSGRYSAADIRFDIRRMVEERGGLFHEATVTRIDPEEPRISLESGETLDYDLISFNTGSRIPKERLATATGDGVFTVKPIEGLYRLQKYIMDRRIRKERGPMALWVAGGGPAGIESAANLRALVRSHDIPATVTLVAGRRLMAGFADKARSAALDALAENDITVREGIRLQSAGDAFVTLSDGRSHDADAVLLAIGIEPSPIFRSSGLPVGPNGGLLVNRYLQSPRYPEIFGGGDCIDFAPVPLKRVGVYAVRQNPLLLHNLLAAANGEPLQPFVPQKAVMLILNMGDGTGLFFRDERVWRGRLAFRLKEWIDWKFMRTFQSMIGAGD